MPSCWDIPPFPEHGDPSAEITWAAVGRALTEWKELELYLVRLYAKTIGVKPIEAISRREYLDAFKFHGRAGVIEEAIKWSVKRPDQASEDLSKRVLDEAREAAKRRNDIAHGVVRLHWQRDKTLAQAIDLNEYMLTPASYNAKKFDSGMAEPAFLYGSVEIGRFADAFKSFRHGKIEAVWALWE